MIEAWRDRDMGRKELAALAAIIEQQLKEGTDSLMGTWTIHFDKERQALYFEKCEFGDYCEERPTVVALDGTVIDRWPVAAA
jgi:hypothetical protein